MVLVFVLLLLQLSHAEIAGEPFNSLGYNGDYDDLPWEDYLSDSLQSSTLDPESTTTTDTLQSSTLDSESTTTTDTLQSSTLDPESTTTTDTLQSSTLDSESTTTTDTLQSSTLDSESTTITESLESSTPDSESAILTDSPQNSTPDSESTRITESPQTSKPDSDQSNRTTFWNPWTISLVALGAFLVSSIIVVSAYYIGKLRTRDVIGYLPDETEPQRIIPRVKRAIRKTLPYA